MKVMTKKVPCWNRRKRGHINKDCDQPKQNHPPGGKGSGKGHPGRFRTYIVNVVSCYGLSETAVLLVTLPGKAVADTGAGKCLVGRATLERYLEKIALLFDIKKEMIKWFRGRMTFKGFSGKLNASGEMKFGSAELHAD